MTEETVLQRASTWFSEGARALLGSSSNSESQFKILRKVRPVVPLWRNVTDDTQTLDTLVRSVTGTGSRSEFITEDSLRSLGNNQGADAQDSSVSLAQGESFEVEMLAGFMVAGTVAATRSFRISVLDSGVLPSGIADSANRRTWASTGRNVTASQAACAIWRPGSVHAFEGTIAAMIPIHVEVAPRKLTLSAGTSGTTAFFAQSTNKQVGDVTSIEAFGRRVSGV